MGAELSDHLDRGGIAIRRVASGTDARDAELGMATAVPMDRDDGFIRRVIEVEDDFPDQNVGDPLLRVGVRSHSIPCCRQVAGELHQRRAIDLRA